MSLLVTRRKAPSGAFAIFGSGELIVMRTNIYVDGFNLYYQALKNSKYKWLNVRKLCEVALHEEFPDLNYGYTCYFTARVKPTVQDPNKHVRQDVFFQALKNQIPNFYKKEGHFLEKPKKASTATLRELSRLNPPKKQSPIRVAPKKGSPYFATLADEYQTLYVRSREEKGSDVNLAVSMLQHAWLDYFECAVLISNDSDLVEAVRLTKKQKKKVILLTHENTAAKQLRKYVSNVVTFNATELANSQMPDQIPGTKLHKPNEW